MLERIPENEFKPKNSQVEVIDPPSQDNKVEIISLNPQAGETELLMWLLVQNKIDYWQNRSRG